MNEARQGESSINKRQLQELNNTEDDFMLLQHEETITSNITVSLSFIFLFKIYYIKRILITLCLKKSDERS